MRQTSHAKPQDIPWMNGAGELWQTISECQREMLEFLSHRLAKDSDALHRLGECKDLKDVSAIQSKWLQETLQDYTTETIKVMDIVTKHAGNGHARVERH